MGDQLDVEKDLSQTTGNNIICIPLLLLFLNGLYPVTCTSPNLCVWAPPFSGAPLYASIAMIAGGAILVSFGYLRNDAAKDIGFDVQSVIVRIIQF